MTPNPIAKVLFSIRKHNVRALLMGGQACILYGAAEFSRDVDLAVLADARNLDRLQRALVDLQAEAFFFPPLSREALDRGHACHFRSHRPGLDGIRIDVMSTLHGCEAFPLLWKRRKRLQLPGLGVVPVLGLWDLVKAKKTQGDKDWPMVRRLVEVDYYQRSRRPGGWQIDFWLLECRTPDILRELCGRYPRRVQRLAAKRTLLKLAALGQEAALAKALRVEEDKYRAADREYWQPLRQELFMMRQAQRTR